MDGVQQVLNHNKYMVTDSAVYIGKKFTLIGQLIDFLQGGLSTCTDCLPFIDSSDLILFLDPSEECNLSFSRESRLGGERVCL